MSYTCWFEPIDRQDNHDRLAVPTALDRMRDVWHISEYIGLTAAEVQDKCDEAYQTDIQEKLDRRNITKLSIAERNEFSRIMGSLRLMATTTRDKTRVLVCDTLPFNGGKHIQQQLQNVKTDTPVKVVVQIGGTDIEVKSKDDALGIYQALHQAGNPNQYVWLRIAGVMN